jgi:hypothetical protein
VKQNTAAALNVCLVFAVRHVVRKHTYTLSTKYCSQTIKNIATDQNSEGMSNKFDNVNEVISMQVVRITPSRVKMMIIY